MDAPAPSPWQLEHTYATAMPEASVPWQAAPVATPRLLMLNEGLAARLGLDAAKLASLDGVRRMLGQVVDENQTPVALAYAGHQFGGFSPQLGDGRALLLGELAVGGQRYDVHLKGSGRTPFARGGDGKAAVGPMLREYLMGEAMHGLGIPTTRALAVVATSETIAREQPLPGAVLVRIAQSHLRVGTFEFFAARQQPQVVQRLVRYALARHYPELREAANPALALLEGVIARQATLIAKWMAVGFIHGVMNTDNMTISGETIDYGPCAFMDAYAERTVFSSIDHGGRYAYGNQPTIAKWNLARLAEACLPLLADDEGAAVERAMAMLATFDDLYRAAWLREFRGKLGLAEAAAPQDDAALVHDFLALLAAHAQDFTLGFAALAEPHAPLWALPEFHAWRLRWTARTAGDDATAVATRLREHNPRFVPRNHHVEHALNAAIDGDLAPFRALLAVVQAPFDEHPQALALREPASLEAQRCHRTYCGT